MMVALNALELRDATAQDLGVINDIYNHYVAVSDCTLQLEPSSAAERQAWFQGRTQARAVLVGEVGGVIVGWGALSPFSERRGYQFTVENSVYLRADQQGRGYGKAILRELIARARQAGLHRIIAKISATQATSLALHAKAGFKHVGVLTEAGLKFDRWVDVVLMELAL
jgi:phosphinothricin acetyltransferase